MRDALERGRYAQIALSYAMPLPMRIWAVLTALCVTWIVCVRDGHKGVQMVMLATGGSFVVWFGAMVTAHAKEQLSDARAALTPGYRRPHLIVAAAMFVVGVIGLSMLISNRA